MGVSSRTRLLYTYCTLYSGISGLLECITLSRVSNYPYLYILYSTLRYELWKLERVRALLYRRICGDRKLSNRLTSASAPNTNKTYGGNLLLRYVLHAIHSRQCGSLHQRRKHGAPRCLRAQRSTVDHRGARPLAPHARPPWHSESVWKHKI